MQKGDTVQASNASGDRQAKRGQSGPEVAEDGDRLDEDLARLYEAYGDEPPSEEVRRLAQKLQTAVDEVSRGDESIQQRPLAARRKAGGR